MKAKSENGGKSVAVNVRLSKEVYDDLLLIMAKNGMTKTEAIEKAIVRYVALLQFAEFMAKPGEVSNELHG